MRIRAQLVLMMSAVVAPLALLAGSSIYALGQAQREVHAQRYLERVSALRLALDNEIQGTTRMLEGLAFTGGVADGAVPAPQARATLQWLLQSFPLWTAAGVIDAEGQPVVDVHRAGRLERLEVDGTTLQRVLAQRGTVVSDLVPGLDGAGFHTFIVTPVVREGRVVRAVYVAMDDRAWLDFLRAYPIADGATLTLNDRQGRIIARTLNHAQWVGKTSRTEYWESTLGRQEGSFDSPGLEGQRFHIAFSRLRTSSWVLGTGVPAERIEAALQLPALLTAGGLAVAMLVALGIALMLGRRIIDSLEPLAALAQSGGHALPAPQRLPIREAEAARQALRQALADLASALVQAERLAKAKDEFLAMLAHELRNPLAAIRSATAVLGMPRVTPEGEKRAREVLERQVGHMVRMVDELLDAARLSSGNVRLEPKALDLAQAVRRVLQLFEQAGRTAQLRIGTELQPVLVRADETRIEQIISNLVDNAAKYARKDGQLRISLREHEGQAELAFSDNGSGLAPELLPRIFEPFSQGERSMDRAQGGLGLGLHVVRRLVELHGGTVQAHSEGVDRGATFIVRLPAVAAETEGAPAAEGVMRLKPLRIALVEDNRDVEEMTSSLLRLAGHQVVCAVDGESAVALVQGQQTEVALLDIGLPGIDGLEVARRIRALRSPAAVVLIALTGYGDTRTREAAAAAGFDAFLQKPFDLRSFEEAVLDAWSHGGSRGSPAAVQDAGRPG
ncbi:hybrid sensor histidine kinase/response regulator [Azohydromonas caseinilytica]|uniref:histidine kinase n=1 Tax=Azohydromonas caseinilytica TaxID=2728836 RepID=A0A848FEA1_9BURK|nr:ATP-binding protein [Azohydromonas caseinilytica]NML16603.1 response regulator [Azohydromonas caseinilytica]